MIETIVAFLITAIVCASVVFIILSFGRSRQRRFELQAEVQTKLIERFASAPELVQFLHSQAGREFMNGVQSNGRMVAGDRVLAGIRRAIVLAFVGLAFVGLWGITGENGFAFPGLILLALGAGYFIAAVVSMKLAQHLSAPAVTPSVPSAPTTTDISV